MDYFKHYTRLCSTRKLLNRSKKEENRYYESHHIVPRSLGGSNRNENLVLLTAKEHYIAHLLLFFHYKQIGGPPLRKMAFALVSMNARINSEREIISSRIYSFLREAAILSSLGRKVDNTENYQKPKSKKHRQAIREARLKAPRRSKETRERMRIAAFKRGNNFTGNLTTSKCPHCNKVGQTNAMLRWHFSNCKFKEETVNAVLA